MPDAKQRALILTEDRNKNRKPLIIVHLSMSPPPRGWPDYLRELDNFENSGSNSLPCDTILCQKSPGRAFKLRYDSF